MNEKVAWVTGAGQGIGLAIATELGQRGAKIVVGELDAERGEGAVVQLAERGVEAISVTVDVSDPAATRAAASTAVDRFGRLDALVNNAGFISPGRSENVDPDDWRKMIDVHLSGTFYCCQAAFPSLSLHGGTIVNIASVTGRLGSPGRASYAAAKTGIEALSRTLAVEWAPQNIRVNAIAPGWVMTAPIRRAIDEGIVDGESMYSRIPLRRLGEPHEIAKAVAYLSSDDSSYMTGHTLVLDGGFSISGDVGAPS